MTYPDKTYVAFDGDSDIHYYYLLKAWHQNDGTVFNFSDAHDVNYAFDTSLTDSIKKQLLVRFNQSKIFILLVGENTKYLRKFIPWEIQQALRLNLPIIVVNLNGSKRLDTLRCPRLLIDELVMHISFNCNILQYAMENWPIQHFNLKRDGRAGDYFYPESIYHQLGIR